MYLLVQISHYRGISLYKLYFDWSVDFGHSSTMYNVLLQFEYYIHDILK